MGVYKTSGSQILDRDGHVFIPRGVNYGTYLANNMPPQSNAEILKAVDVALAWGMNCVRLVLNGGTRYGWSIANAGYKGLTGVDASFARACEDIDLWRSRGIIAIPECHDFTTTLSTTGGNAVTQTQIDQFWAETVDFWTRIAGKYKNDDGVWFNLYNEPYVEGDVWKTRHQTAVAAIRATGANNIIVVDAPRWGQDYGVTPGSGVAINAWEPNMAPALSAQYGNIVLSHHSYGATITSEATAEAYIAKVQSAGIPLFFGEIGWRRLRTANNATADDLARASSHAVFNVATKMGCGGAWWATQFNDEFSIWYDPISDKNANLVDADTTVFPFTEGGRTFKAWLDEALYSKGLKAPKTTEAVRVGGPIPVPTAPLAIFRAALALRANNRVTWLACGGSNTAGKGVTAAQAWPAKLATAIQKQWPSTTGAEAATIANGGTLGEAGQFQMVNMGRSDTHALNYLVDADLTFIANAKPQIVSHSVGSVEYGSQWTPQLLKAKIQHQMQKIDDALVAAGADVPMHVVIQHPVRGDVNAKTALFQWGSYRRALWDLAESAPRVLFVDLQSEGEALGLGGAISTDPLGLRQANSVDFSAAGHTVLADLIFATLTGQMSALCAPPVQPPGLPQATPLPPSFIDKLGTTNDQLVIPSVGGVQYQLNGTDIAAGTYDSTKAAGSITVIATSKAGYDITPGATSSWSYTYSSGTTLPAEPTSGKITSDSLLVSTADGNVDGRYADLFNGGVQRVWTAVVGSSGRAITRQNKGVELFNATSLGMAVTSPDVKITFTHVGAASDDGKVVLRGPMDSATGPQIRAAIRAGSTKFQAAQIAAAGGSEVVLGTGIAFTPGTDVLSAAIKGNQLTVKNETTGVSETVTATANATASQAGLRVGAYSQITIKNVVIEIPA